MKQSLVRIFLLISLTVTVYSGVSAQGALIDFNTIPKSGTILILSHMDDDLIWMLPWWKITEKFISGAMPNTEVYQIVVDQQQAYLDAHGYNIDYRSNWIMPWGTITMNQYSDYYWDDLPSAQYLAADHLIAYWDDSNLQLVRTEVDRIKARLEQYISDPAVSRIVTHNNWGEYGHQHHRAVNKAVRELAVKYRKDVWMLGCNNGDFIDVDVPNGITYTLGTFNDPTLFTSIRTIYKNNWCWTWPDNIPSGDHKFIEIVDGGEDKSTLLTGETVTFSGPVQYETGSFIFDGIDDYMTMWSTGTTSFTIAMKVRPEVIRYMDISKMTEYPGNPTSDRNFVLNANGTVSARIYDGSSRVATSTSSLSAGNWSHIAMVGNGSSLKIYVNGVLENTITAGSAVTNYESAEFVMGQTGITSSFFSGQISSVGIYDRAFTDSEIAGLSGVVHTITATAASGGTITPTGSVSVAEGSNRVFTISANVGYRIDDVVVDGASVGAVSTYTFTGVVADHTISATFATVPTFTIAASAGTGGTISPSGNVPVNQGGSQVFTINPNTGYRISGVLVDGIPAGTISSCTFSNVTDNHTISASFAAIPTYNISASSGAGGSVSPAGTTTVSEGGSQTYTISASAGYAIASVLVDNIPVGAITSYTFSNVTSGHTISATFSQLTYTITSSAGTGGSISPSGTVTVNHGGSRTFDIIPDAGYAVNSVRVDNVPMGALSSYTFSNVTANHTISVTFSVLSYTITASAGAGGTISPSGAVSVTHGASRTFAVSAATGYSLSDVLVDNVSVGPVSSYTFSNVTSNHTISAIFVLNTFTISGSAGQGGSISPSGVTTTGYGTNQAYSIIPNSGYNVADVLVDNVSIGPVTSYTFTSVTANHTISATFSQLSYTITASYGTGGTMSPSGVISKNYGASQTYTISPANGYRISDVRVDNISVGAVPSYTFSNITANHTISASFVLITYTLSASAGKGGSISPSGTATVDHGSSRTYVITPLSGYEITDVIVDGISVGKTAEYTFEGITGNHTISAAFGHLQYRITAKADNGGTITPDGETVSEYGTSLTYSVSVSEGYNLTDLIVDNESVGIVTTYTFKNITSDHTISAVFTPVTFTITASAGSNGTISPSGACSVYWHSSRSFEVIPANGYRTADVRIDGVSVGAVGSYTFENVETDHIISATFEFVAVFSISATAGEGGKISPTGVISVPEESNQSYKIIPDEGFRIYRVTVDGKDLGTPGLYTFNSISSDHSISAEFTSETEVTAYPNPFMEEFSIRIESPLEDRMDLYVYDVAARIVHSQTGIDPAEIIKVNLRSSPRGLYILKLYCNNVKVRTLKVVKK